MYCFSVFALENDTYFDGCLMTWIFEQRALYLSFTLSFTCFMWQVTEVDERPRALTLESIENPLNSIRYDTNATRLLFRVLFLSHPAIHANRNKLNDRIRIQSHRQWADDNYQQIKCYDHLIQSVVIFFMYVSRPAHRELWEHETQKLVFVYTYEESLLGIHYTQSQHRANTAQQVYIYLANFNYFQFMDRWRCRCCCWCCRPAIHFDYCQVMNMIYIYINIGVCEELARIFITDPLLKPVVSALWLSPRCFSSLAKGFEILAAQDSAAWRERANKKTTGNAMKIRVSVHFFRVCSVVLDNIFMFYATQYK